MKTGTKTKHTAGPWKSEFDGYEVFAKRKEFCCVVMVMQEHHEYKANARLIAAAPELLEACKDGLHIALTSGLNEKDDDVVRRIKAAISHAERD